MNNKNINHLRVVTTNTNKGGERKMGRVSYSEKVKGKWFTPIETMEVNDPRIKYNKVLSKEITISIPEVNLDAVNEKPEGIVDTLLHYPIKAYQWVKYMFFAIEVEEEVEEDNTKGGF